MSIRVQPHSSRDNFKDYVIQKKWVAVAILATSIAIAAITLICAAGLFATHHLLTQGLNPTLLILPATIVTIGLSAAIALFINNGRSPLHRSHALTRELMYYLNAQDYEGNTLLHYIADGRELLLGAKILNDSPNVNIKNNKGLIPLQVAAMSKNQFVDVLLGHESAIITIDLVLWAIENKLFDVATKLLAKDNIQGEWRQPLHAAIREGNVDCLRLILNKYTDGKHVDLQDALVLTAKYNNKESHKPLFSLIIAKGVDVNAKHSEFGLNALHQAIINGDNQLIREMRQIPELDLNTPDQQGRSPTYLVYMYHGMDSEMLNLVDERRRALPLKVTPDS